MAAFIVQGGPAPCFLSKEVYDYIVGGIESITFDKWISKIKDARLLEAIHKVLI